MKAKELLRRYDEGTRDFRGENLRGQSFKGKDLSGADFSGADIRGANFTNTTLKGAKFVQAKAGLQKRWAVSLVLASWLLSALSGFLFIVVDVWIVFLMIKESINIVVAGWLTLVVLVIFWIITIRKGILPGFAVIFVFLSVAGAFIVTHSGALSAIGSGVVAGAFAVLGAFCIGAAGAFSAAGNFCVIEAFSLAETFSVTEAFSVVGIGSFATAGALSAAEAFSTVFNGAGTFSVVVALFGVFFSLYLSWRAMKGDPRDAWIRLTAIAFAAIGGTSFRGADLTDADFTNATLKSSDFRRANLTRTLWKDAIKLDRVRPGETYLSQPEIRKLVRTGEGENLNCDRLNLQGVNLQGANLQNASFIEANLNDANLQDADLTNARLVHAQLDGSDLTGATLTGAYIEEWNITTTTKLDGIRCNYVFMRLPPKERPAFIALPPGENRDSNPRRKPDDWQKNFEDGEFSDFIEPMRQTLDLYHNRAVDMRLVAIALQRLKDDNPEAELEVVSMEKRGKNRDKLLIRAETSTQSDHAALNQGYFSNLEYVQSLPPQALQALLVERGWIMQKLLTGVLETKPQSSETKININPNFDNSHNQGDTQMTNDSRSYSSSGNNNRAVQGDKNVSALGDNAQTVQGYNNQLSQGSPVADTELVTKDDALKLMADFEKMINDSELPDETKEELIDYLKATKRAVDKPEPKKELALGNFEEMTKTLKNATETVVASKTLWTTAKPILLKLANWLGAAATASLLIGL